MPLQEVTRSLAHQAIQERRCAWTCAGSDERVTIVECEDCGYQDY